jgi:hypothetical protein
MTPEAVRAAVAAQKAAGSGAGDRGWTWKDAKSMFSVAWVCGFCGNNVATDVGFMAVGIGGSPLKGQIKICNLCSCPTFFPLGHSASSYFPAPLVGRTVRGLPADIGTLYGEARTCAAAGAHTASVMLLRKLLMHVAVEKGAAAGLSFVKYVEYLESKSYIPPDGKAWVDEIRQRGNEANHDIVIFDTHDSELMLGFAEMLLSIIYDYPNRLPPKPPKPKPSKP